MEIKGKVTHLLEKQSGTSKAGNNWEKMAFVIETDGEYPKNVCIEGFGKVVPDIEKLKIGDEVLADLNLESREYKDRWYSTINCWRVSVQEAAQADKPLPKEGDKDLPF